MASASAPRRSARARRPLPQPADRAMASTSARRRSARARRPLPQPADRATASTSARRRSAKARRSLPQPSDRAAASTSARRRSARGPAAQTFLPDEIWEEIFLRLDAAADLARASAACSTFRRIVCERRFLRRFRSLHSPPVLGFISMDERLRFVPVDPSHRSAPEARALEQTADSTFSFLPKSSGWRFRYALDGRVLLARRIVDRRVSTKTHLEDFLVCDPLYRRYVKIPRIPDDLMASTPCTGTLCLSPVLAPAVENDEEESFRVIYTVLFDDKVMAFVFSSCNQTWRGIISTICLPNGYKCYTEYKPYYARGCLFWMVYDMGYSLMLDTNTSELEFCIVDLPPHDFGSSRVIVEAEEGRLWFLTIANGSVDLYCKNWLGNGVGAQELQHHKLISLPKGSGINYTWAIVGTVWRYLALFRRELSKSEYFVLDTKTLLLEKVCTSSNLVFFRIPYARFPPPLALPSI